MADKMTRVQFALSEKNLDVLRYLAAEQEVPTSVMLRMILRDLYNTHKAKLVVWKMAHGYSDPDGGDDPVDMLARGDIS